MRKNNNSLIKKKNIGNSLPSSNDLIRTRDLTMFTSSCFFSDEEGCDGQKKLNK